MSARFSASSSRRLAFLFLAVVVPPAVTLIWLGLQLLDQDRALLAQRDMERQESAADQIVRSLEISLAELERTPDESLPEGIVRLEVSPSGVSPAPSGCLLWYPTSAGFEEAESARFAELELLEFRGERGRALDGYRQLVESSIANLRAGALLRMARVYRQSNRWEEALRAYRQLAEIEEVAFNGMPAGLLARRAICSVMEQAGKRSDLKGEASALQRELLSGRWSLDRPAWELTIRQLEQWTGRPLPDTKEKRLFSNLASWLWDQQQRGVGETVQEDPRQTMFGEVTLFWSLSDLGMEVTAIAPRALQSFVSSALRGEDSERHQLSLTTPAGELLAGVPAAAEGALVRRLASETGLPWTLILGRRTSLPVAEELARRRRLLMLGLAAIVLLLSGGSYLLWRVIRQELEIARLQTEFVSAVSHEFRTPLASLRHVTELMQEDDNVPPERRQVFYESLGRNTERLHRLVESLLDFARMEGKKKPFNLRPIDVGEVVTSAVADFRREVEPRGFEVGLDMDREAKSIVDADRDALSNALWNLLDNAVKYSAGRHCVQVSVRQNSEEVTIAVQDKGLGIPKAEQQAIFRRFFRGAKAGELGIRGTGLGLSMVSHIVQAHNGKIELESVEGDGSTFRIVLPLGEGPRQTEEENRPCQES